MNSFRLSYSGWALNRELQIVQADVVLEIDGRSVVEEPLCVDVGMPALIWSATRDIEPDRFAPPDRWERAPFFVCGCGDPECRAYPFAVRHRGNKVILAELEQADAGQTPREADEFEVDLKAYRAEVERTARQFLAFIGGHADYRPLYSDTVAKVQEGLAALEALDVESDG